MLTEFVAHLEELRKRLLFCAAFFLGAALISYFFARPILDFLTEPLRTFPNTVLVFQKPYEAFLAYLKVAFFAGGILASPVFFTQAWLFVAPGLYPKERKVLFPLIFVSILLFLGGVAFCYWLVIPVGLHFLLSFESETLKPMITVGAYFSFLTGTMIAFGVLFDFPIVLIGLVDLGVVQTKALAAARRVMIVVIFIMAAVLTPSPDPVSQLLLALPLVLLFEVSLWIARWKEKKREKASGR